MSKKKEKKKTEPKQSKRKIIEGMIDYI